VIEESAVGSTVAVVQVTDFIYLLQIDSSHSFKCLNKIKLDSLLVGCKLNTFISCVAPKEAPKLIVSTDTKCLKLVTLSTT
jgi:hypothetical protein